VLKIVDLNGQRKKNHLVHQESNSLNLEIRLNR